MFKELKREAEKFNGRRSLSAVLLVVLAAVILSYFLPRDPADFGMASLIPAAFLIAYIFATQRILEALTLASVTGFIMVSRPDVLSPGGNGDWLIDGWQWFHNILTAFSDAALSVMMSEDIAWLIIVCGLMGSIIALIEKAGGSFAFGEWIAARARTRKSALICTWILGIVVFIDDYLNSLTVGSCMAPLTDRHKVPREFLAYVVDSTAAPLCVIIPISTWAVFCSRILETNGWAPAGQGLLYFVKTVPYNFYGWIAAAVVPLVILGVIPTFGPMKKAEARVRDGGPLAPEGSEKIDIRAGADMGGIPADPKMRNLFAPIIVLVMSTIFFNVDMQLGVLFTLGFMFIFFLAQDLMTAEDFADVMLQGLKNMMMPLMLMILAFLFAEVNEQIHFTYYVITTATQYMTPALMPVTVFIVLAVTEFITGTNWGMYIIALPIVIPLAVTLDANVTLTVSAVLSAGVFGSHICFYSDATVITSSATGCNNFDHAYTQAPFGLFCAGLSALLFLAAGFVL
ncbi:Na+/H+ antiporter NhaC family protein [Bacilliculturomica massiliensis]|uniref:Na+/H+ antiporter NhaC family protein n=1 Tax=Bacilliculturomica massiliensis TaxID=1917867 RepID=UPI00102F78EC|nr:Na+/H+ antiporter NhaC family protein [Bacilliculturomica massiliensis]